MGRFIPNLNKSESHLWAHRDVFVISDSLQHPVYAVLTKMLLYLAVEHLPLDVLAVPLYFRYYSFSLALPTAVKASYLICFNTNKFNEIRLFHLKLTSAASFDMWYTVLITSKYTTIRRPALLITIFSHKHFGHSINRTSYIHAKYSLNGLSMNWRLNSYTEQ